jgi:hypothetical protein
MTGPLREHPAVDRAGSYGLTPERIDGNDADECYTTAVRALQRARSGKGPSLIEAVTYRHGGHSRADPRLLGWGAEIASLAADEGFWHLDGPVQRITTPHIPLPSADSLEDLVLPSADLVVQTVEKAIHQ